MLRPQQIASPVRQVQGSLPAAASMAFGPAGAASIINRGAYVTWQYAGLQYQAVSNPIINGKSIFLPLIVKGTG
jgi:hypothetical protein